MNAETKKSFFQIGILDVWATTVIVLVTLIVFGYCSNHLGFYADDAGFLTDIHLGMSLSELVDSIRTYVTGRNLHILWHYFVTIAAGGNSLENLPAMHYIQVAFDTANAVLLFGILRLWKAHIAGAFLAAIAFSVFPNHGETHFWLSALPMNIISTFFVLLLLWLCTLLLQNMSKNNISPSVHFIAPLILLVFICAMFTYDQAVPVTMAIVSVVTAILAYKYRTYLFPVILSFLFCLTVFVTLVIWKSNVPGGGPSFTNLTANHIYITFLQSVGIWASLFVLPYDPFSVASIPEINQAYIESGTFGLVLPTLVFASETIRWVSILLTAAVLCSFLIFMKKKPQREIDKTQITQLNTQSIRLKDVALLFFIGLSFFLFAYLPGYLWYLSPRHSYLPSVGIAVLLAAVSTVVTWLAQRFFMIKFLLLPLIGLWLVSFFSADMIEKEFWISSYSIRKNMYQDLSDSYHDNNPTTILLAGFPSTPQPGAPTLSFLTGESPGALSIMTNGKVKASHIGLHPVPSQSGYFVKTEIGRWGDNAVIHIEKNDATVIKFEGLSGNHVKTIYDINHKAFNFEEFYTLTPLDRQNTEKEINFVARKKDEGYELQIPSIVIKQNEVLALIPQIEDGKKISPFYYLAQNDSEKFLIPIDVSGNRNATTDLYHLTYRTTMPKIDAFNLYVIDGEQQKFIGTAQVQ